MQEHDDIALLREYREQHSEAAFATLVARHIDKIYSVALRHTRNSHQAEEITQQVFVLLARNAERLATGVVLSGWLYQTARLTAVSFVRGERRRARREQEALAMNSTDESDPEIWPQIAPHLDLAMAALSEIDRHAIVLRFFDGRTLSQIGAALGASEEAAKKRVSRALEKLRQIFTARGVTLPVALLAGALAANAVQAAPVGLAKTVSTVALAQGAAAGGSLLAVLKGLCKPLTGAMGAATGLVGALAGALFFTLKAEVENTKSERERRLVGQMIRVRFGIALLFVALPLLVGAVVPSLFAQPEGIVFGFAGWCLVGAIESAVRLVYFQRRRWQIQIEDGTWEESGGDERTAFPSVLAEVPEKAAATEAHLTNAAAFCLIACALLTFTLLVATLTSGHFLAAVLVLLWSGFACYRVCHRMQWANLVAAARPVTPVKVLLYFGALTLVLFDFAWARGRLSLGVGGAIGFNAAVLFLYAALSGLFARLSVLRFE